MFSFIDAGYRELEQWTIPVEETKELVPKVLLVEDDPIFAKKMERLAKLKHVDLTVCKSVGEVCRLKPEQRFDVALLDYFFGELTARQIMSLLPGHIPLVFISASDEKNREMEALPWRVRSFIHKDEGMERLLAEAWAIAGKSPRAAAIAADQERLTRWEWLIAGALSLLLFFGATKAYPATCDAPAKIASVKCSHDAEWHQTNVKVCWRSCQDVEVSLVDGPSGDMLVPTESAAKNSCTKIKLDFVDDSEIWLRVMARDGSTDVRNFGCPGHYGYL